MNKKQGKSFRYRDELSGWLLVLPAVLAIAFFQIVPLVMALIRSFQDYSTGEFIGFRNYSFVLKQEVFTDSFLNIILFLIFIMAIMLVITFLFAQVLKNMKNRFGSATKILIYLPTLFSGILVSIMFLFIFNYGGGLITSLLLGANKDPIPFTLAMPWPHVLIIGISIWGGVGYHSLVMYAGAISIPESYYEAAMLDGANAIKRLWYITLPCMKNYFILTIINLATGTLMMFELPMMITGGGPDNKTMTPILYIYNMFNDFTMDKNITIAGAILVAILTCAINVIVFKIIKSEKSMDD